MLKFLTMKNTEELNRVEYHLPKAIGLDDEPTYLKIPTRALRRHQYSKQAGVVYTEAIKKELDSNNVYQAWTTKEQTTTSLFLFCLHKSSFML